MNGRKYGLLKLARLLYLRRSFRCKNYYAPNVCRCRSPRERVKARASGNLADPGVETRLAHSFRTFL